MPWELSLQCCLAAHRHSLKEGGEGGKEEGRGEGGEGKEGGFE